MSHQAWNYTPEDGFQINTKCEAHPVNTSQPQLRTSMWGSGVLARFSFMPLITGTVIVAGVLTTHFLLHIFLKKMQWSSFGGGGLQLFHCPPVAPQQLDPAILREENQNLAVCFRSPGYFGLDFIWNSVVDDLHLLQHRRRKFLLFLLWTLAHTGNSHRLRLTEALKVLIMV